MVLVKKERQEYITTERVVEVKSERTALLDLSTHGELHSYIDLPERLERPASE